MSKVAPLFGAEGFGDPSLTYLCISNQQLENLLKLITACLVALGFWSYSYPSDGLDAIFFSVMWQFLKDSQDNKHAID